MNNFVSSKVVSNELKKQSPEDQLRDYVKMWDDLDCQIINEKLIESATKIRQDIYRLCERNNWQLPVFKRYDFYLPFSDL